MTEIFLTHDWANDELGRNNHDRVKRVYHRLTELGVTAWFDEEAMRGDINNTVFHLSLPLLHLSPSLSLVAIRARPVLVSCAA